MVLFMELPNGNECTATPGTCCRELANPAHDMLRKAREHKGGGYKTILERWHDDDKHRKSWSEIGWTEEQIIQHDELALEDHCFFATRGERNHNEKSWVRKARN